MFWKEESLVSKSSFIPIYAICLQVGVPRRFRYFSLLDFDPETKLRNLLSSVPDTSCISPVQMMHCSQNKIKRKGGYFLGTMDELLEKVKGKVVFCGDALSLYQDRIKKHRGVRPVLAAEKFWFPSAVSFSRLCYGMYRRKDFTSARQITPLYLYQDTCTVRKRIRN